MVVTMVEEVIVVVREVIVMVVMMMMMEKVIYSDGGEGDSEGGDGECCVRGDLVQCGASNVKLNPH